MRALISNSQSVVLQDMVRVIAIRIIQKTIDINAIGI